MTTACDEIKVALAALRAEVAALREALDSIDLAADLFTAHKLARAALARTCKVQS